MCRGEHQQLLIVTLKPRHITHSLCSHCQMKTLWLFLMPSACERWGFSFSSRSPTVPGKMWRAVLLVAFEGCKLPSDLSALCCSLIMFYFIALAGAHKRVVVQLREQLSLVRKHAGPLGHVWELTERGTFPRNAAVPLPLPLPQNSACRPGPLQHHSFTDSFIPSSCILSMIYDLRCAGLQW